MRRCLEKVIFAAAPLVLSMGPAVRAAAPVDQFHKLTDLLELSQQFGPSFVGMSSPVLYQGNAAFIGFHQTDSGISSGLYRTSGSGVAAIADSSIVPPGAATGVTSVAGPSGWTSGGLLFSAATADTFGVYRYDGAALTLLHGAGEALPHGSEHLVTVDSRTLAYDASNYAFAATRDDNEKGLYGRIDGTFHRFADVDTPVPFNPLDHFSAFTSVHTGLGQVAFVAQAEGTEGGVEESESAGVFLARPGEPIQTLVSHHQIVPGDQETFNAFDNVRVRADGRVSFNGGFIEEFSTEHHVGIYTVDPANNDLSVMVDQDTPLANLQGEVFGFTGFSIDGDLTCFGVQDDTGHTYLYALAGDGLAVDLLDTNGLLDGKALQVLSLSSDSLNDGLLAFRADFQDGTSGLYTVAVPEPLGAGLSVLGLVGAALLRRRPKET